MRLDDINIRDPFVLVHNNIYYLYGTNCGICDAYEKDSDKLGFYVYTSVDFEEWQGPKRVFEPTDDFWADRNFWAPEVHLYNDKFYMFATFKSQTRCRGTQILVSDKPDGKFVPLTEFPITPSDWECLDGTFYVDKHNKPHMIFCHEWMQIGDGTVCEIELSEDLKEAVTKPRVLWKASDNPDIVDVRKTGVTKVTDGPFIYRTKNGELLCVWSSFCKDGYCELVSRSDNGDIDGNWTVDREPIFGKNGGHGMIFDTIAGKRMFVMHTPNDPPYERVALYEVNDTGNSIKISKKEPV